MHESVIEVSEVFLIYGRLFYCVKSNTNKDWERLVPAAAVIPAVRVGATFIGSKAFVAGFVNLL